VDRNEAKLLLQACRPDGQDDALPAFGEALALVERDPELKAWWEAQRAFDRAVSAKLQGVPLPSDLRATILAGRKIEQMTPRYRLPVWLAAAAVMMLCLGLAFYFKNGSQLAGGETHAQGFPALASHDYQKGSIAFLEDDGTPLGLLSHDHGQVTEWLKQQHSPLGTIPARMESLPSLGCQTFAVQGHTVSLICFTMTGGGVCHLFTIDKQALADPPGTAPAFSHVGSWATATWSDAGHTYMLATQADPDMLRHLL
jgi:hypothetical protein